jgi:hypothetical protein
MTALFVEVDYAHPKHHKINIQILFLINPDSIYLNIIPKLKPTYTIYFAPPCNNLLLYYTLPINLEQNNDYNLNILLHLINLY